MKNVHRESQVGQRQINPRQTFVADRSRFTAARARSELALAERATLSRRWTAHRSMQLDKALAAAELDGAS